MGTEPVTHFNLLLLFTHAVSLRVWEQQGLIDRELEYYQVMQDQGLGNVALMTYGADDSQYETPVSPFIVLPKRCFSNNFVYSLLAPFIHWSAFRSADIVKSNQLHGAWVGAIAKLLMPRKVFIVRCGWVPTRENMRRYEQLDRTPLWRAKLKNWLEWLSFHFSDAIFVTTLVDKQYIESTYQVQAEKIRIVPNSVDTDLFAPPGRERNWANPIRLISVGRHVQMKNFQSLILAVKGLNQDTEITLIGNGPYKETLVDLSKKEGVTVNFVSFIPNDDLPAYLRKADVFVMPQLYGSGMSKVILEAMACGLVTIGSNIQPHQQVLVDGENGFLCDVDPISIRQCLECVLSMSPGNLNAISARARQDVIENYSMQANARRELDIFASLRR